jgi:hypothetical protein
LSFYIIMLWPNHSGRTTILYNKDSHLTSFIHNKLLTWRNTLHPDWFLCLTCKGGRMKICGPILGISKSLTDTWIWKVGLRPRNSFSGNTYRGFFLQCNWLCAVRWKQLFYILAAHSIQSWYHNYILMLLILFTVLLLSFLRDWLMVGLCKTNSL